MRLNSIILLVVVAIMSSCISTETTTKSSRKVRCEVVTHASDHREEAQFPGRVVAAQDVNLSFRVAGVIESIVATEGQFVRKGEVIAYMDSRDYKLQLAATEAEERGIRAEAERVIALYEDRSTSENNYDKAVNGLKQIEAKLEAHRNALRDTELRAPFDGYLQRRHFEGGEAVSAGMPIVAFVSATAPEVVINIPVQNYLRRGDLCSASAVAQIYPDTKFTLEPISVAPKANLNQLYTTRFRVVPIEGVELSAGMSIMATIEYCSDQDNLLSLPMAAMVERGGRSSVWVVKDGVASLREVSIESFTRSGRALVSGGVEAGEVIVTAGVASLKEGMSVEVLESVSSSNIGGIL